MAELVTTNPYLPRVGRLATLPQVRRELVKIYAEVRQGRLESQEGTRLCYLLTSVARLIETGDAEARLERLEELMSGLNRNI
jgi:hypothetical protein